MSNKKQSSVVKSMISRMTMKAKCHLFDDKVTGLGVYLYEDKYGVEWLSNYPFWFWISNRVRKWATINKLGWREQKL